MLEAFIAAIRSKNKVRITFFSKEDGGNLTRVCAPMDYGPSRRAADKTERFHLWDYESDKSQHVLSLLPSQIIGIEVLQDNFDPAGFVSWSVTKAPWFTSRDWGQYS